VTSPEVKFFFLVEGFEYSNKGLDLDKMGTGRVNERIAFINRTFKASDPLVSNDTILRFLRFRPGTGTIQVLDRKFVAGAGIKHKFVVQESDWAPLGSIGTGDRFDPNTFVKKDAGVDPTTGLVIPFRAINRATDYTNLAEKYPDFKQGPSASDVMSIADVYESVRAAPLGSVLELSFLSHGWVGGPILVNSSDQVHDPNKRDPTDKDGRGEVDFNPTMGEEDDLSNQGNILKFLLSFDVKGVMRSWGCNFDIEIRVIQQTQNRIRRGGVIDATVINFHIEKKKDRERYSVIDPSATFFPSSPTQTDFSRTFREVMKFLRARLWASYAVQFASHSNGSTAFGALPGTYAENEKSAYNLQKVCAKKDPFECDDGFASVFHFYRTQLGIKVDNRGYGIFDQATTQNLAAQIAANP
jgi:hypothetical protein